ncbi:MAG TPA: alpha-amylase, partial [Terracidiphilus sp.]|nr:alpha-amylase [Terracidiphilus sp.]
FGAKTRTIQSVLVRDWVDLSVATENESGRGSGVPARPDLSAALLYVEIQYANGPSDLYQIPLAISPIESSEIANQYPLSVLTTLTMPTGNALLHDATVLESVRQRLLALIDKNATLAMSTALGPIVLVDTPPAVDETQAAQASIPAATVDGEVMPLPMPVAPVPISAQPGEAAAPPRSTAPAPSAAQRMQTRESPSAGNLFPSAGRLDAHASSLLKEGMPAQHEASRVGSAEQSNTSILYDQKLILKLFRRLQPGENPDVEIGRFLTEVAKFSHIAPFMGEITITPATGEATTVAMLQKLVPNEGDGWAWFLNQLGSFFASVQSQHAPEASERPGWLHTPPVAASLRPLCGAALEGAALLGQRTAEMHLALATQTQDQAFCAEGFGTSDLEQDAARVETQLTQVVEALKAKLSTLDDGLSDLAVQLLARRHDLARRPGELKRLKVAGQRIRIHGDYHLGQTLRTPAIKERGRENAGDFVILDFEGEPARTLTERRQKQSPLKDVAGMIRSFSYAAASGLERARADRREVNAVELAAWARCWENAVTSEFLDAYAKTMASKPELLPQKEQAQALLNAYTLEKALYELMYELNNRPNWLRIPFAGILAL